MREKGILLVPPGPNSEGPIVIWARGNSLLTAVGSVQQSPPQITLLEENLQLTNYTVNEIVATLRERRFEVDEFGY